MKMYEELRDSVKRICKENLYECILMYEDA